MGLGNVAIDIKIRGAYEGQQAVNSAKADVEALEKGGKSVGETFSGLSFTMKESWAGISAGIGGAVIAFQAVQRAAGAAYDALIEGARANDRINELRKSIEGVDAILDSARAKSAGLIDERALVSALSSFKAYGLEVSKFDDLVEQATKTAIRLGTDPAKAIEDLTLGIARGSTAILDNLGIMVKAEEVAKKYTETTGKQASEMDGAGKVAATMTLALERLAKQNGDVRPAESQAAAIGGIATAAKNTANAVTEAGARIAAFVLEGVPLGQMVTDFDAIADAVSSVNANMEKAASSAARFAGGLSEALSGVKAEASLASALADATAKIEAEESARFAAKLNERLRAARVAAEKLYDPAERDVFLETSAQRAQAEVTSQLREAVAARVRAAEQGFEQVRLIRLGIEDRAAREVSAIRIASAGESSRASIKLEEQVAAARRRLAREQAAFDDARVRAVDAAGIERLRMSADALALTQQEVSAAESAIKRLSAAAAQGVKDIKDALSDTATAALEYDVDEIDKKLLELKRQQAGAVSITSDVQGAGGGFQMAMPDQEVVTGEDMQAEIRRDKEEEEHNKRMERMRELRDGTADALAAMQGSSDDLVATIGRGADAIITNMEAFTGSADEAIAASGRVLAAFINDETAKYAILAVSEVAAGFASLAFYEYEAAAMHFISGAMYGTMAGVSASKASAPTAAPRRERELSPISRSDGPGSGTTVYNVNAPMVVGGEQAGGVQLGKMQRSGSASGMGGGL